jgi:hypothetical protein
MSNLIWTTKKPTKTGWYWWRSAPDDVDHALCLVTLPEGELSFDWVSKAKRGEPSGGEWAGMLDPLK